MLDIINKKSMDNSGRNNVYGLNNAKLINRFGAFLLDMIVALILMVGFVLLGSKICKTDKLQEQLIDKYKEYGIVVADEEDPTVYNTCEYVVDENGNPKEDDPCYLAFKAFSQDEEAVKLQGIFDNTLLIILMASSLLSIMITEFLIPLLIHNHKTLGYWAMHIGILSKECVKPKPVQLFARAIIGRWALEVVPIIYILLNLRGSLVILIVLAVLVVLELISFFFTKNHIWLHDFVANTVPVDADTQYFADSLEELEEKRKGA